MDQSRRVIACDLDGTLFYPKKRLTMLPRENERFVERFLADGGHFLLVTGRTRLYAEKLGRKLGRELDCVGCNGAFVVAGGRLLQDLTLPPAAFRKMYEEVRKEFPVKIPMLFCKHRNMVIPRSSVSAFNRTIYNVYTYTNGTYREPVVWSDEVFDEEIDAGDVYKAMFIFGAFGKAAEVAKEVNKILRERYPDFEFSWSDQAIEITAKGASKREGIALYLDHIGLPPESLIVVGDSGNDISMFEAYKEQSFCMAHAREPVKKHARHIIARVSDLEAYVYPPAEQGPGHQAGEKEGNPE